MGSILLLNCFQHRLMHPDQPVINMVVFFFFLICQTGWDRTHHFKLKANIFVVFIVQCIDYCSKPGGTHILRHAGMFRKNGSGFFFFFFFFLRNP